MLDVLAAHPMLLLALLLLLGSLLGQVKAAGANLGPAAVLFVALALTAWGSTQGVELTVPEVLGTFGLILFTYTVGIISGPNFFGSLKRGWPVMLSTVACLGVAATAAGGVGAALGLPAPVIAGTFAGALTNTPALAAAGQVAGDAELPAVGYSISYLWGVVGMMLASAWALGRANRDGAAKAPRIEQRTIRVDLDKPMAIDELLERHPHAVSISRVQHGSAPVEVAGPHEVLVKHDLVTVVGSADVLTEVATELGHVSSVDIVGDRRHLDFSRVTLSATRLVGHTLAELDAELRATFGGHVSRVRRGDVDMVPDEDFVIQMGDRLRVVAPRDQMRAIRAHLGDSERGFSDINPSGLALGLLVGVLIGLIPIPLPTGTFALGSAAGTLIAGLVFGRMGRIGPLPVSMSTAAAHALSSLGMLVFLAFAGTKAGLLFSDAVTSELGWKIALLGGVVTVVAAVAVLAAGRLVHRTPWVRLAGQLAGAQTQPAVLAFANTRTGFDTQVALGYALVYPAAMIGKILLAQLLVLLA